MNDIKTHRCDACDQEFTARRIVKEGERYTCDSCTKLEWGQKVFNEDRYD